MEVLLEILLFVIFKIPGSFIRWLLCGAKKSALKNYINDGHAYVDGAIGLFVFTLIIILIDKLF